MSSERMARIGGWCISLILGCALAGTIGAAPNPWSDSYYLESQERYAEALAALKPALEQRPVNEFAVLRSGWLNYLAGEYNDAIKAYKRALELNDRSLDAKLGLVLPLLAQQRWREAAMYAQQALEVAPWNYYAHVRLMICEEGQAQWQTLATHAREVAARYPSDATVQVYLARAEAKQGKLEDAKAAYRRVLERYPGHYEASDFLANH